MTYPPLKFTFEGGPKNGEEFKLPPNAPKVPAGLYLDIAALIERGVFTVGGSKVVDGQRVSYSYRYRFTFADGAYRAVYIEPEGSPDV